MFTAEFETFAAVSSQSSRRSSVTSLSDKDYQDADELALKECIEIIDANVEEKKWWRDGYYKIIDENRLPLILVEDVSYEEFEKKCERVNASKFWEYRDGTVVIIELPNRDHESAHGEFTEQFLSAFANLPRRDKVKCVGSTTCSATPERRVRGNSKQSDASFVPKLLPNPAQNPCDTEGNPWPTIIVEVANTQSLASIIQKTIQFWLAPNRVEDVIVLKLWKWNSIWDQNGTPLRRLTIELRTIDKRSQPYNGCSAPGTCTLNISPRCIYRGCPRQPITNNVVIDLYNIQQEIFDNM
ncbi:hypothetical protein RhiirB3_402457 [Rhizophagus irregularis]|nr:hypothetical protein RhiirB3_402457 [Rhizophagus irregularis]